MKIMTKKIAKKKNNIANKTKNKMKKAIPNPTAPAIAMSASLVLSPDESVAASGTINLDEVGPVFCARFEIDRALATRIQIVEKPI